MKSHTLVLFGAVLLLQCFQSGSQECSYKTLEKALIQDENNMLSLSLAFFPPIQNSPEFVAVCYNFSETNEIQKWYWSEFTSSFIHPPEVFQFMSLFFAKPHKFYNGEVHIVLAALGNTTVVKCAKDLPKVQLLTQRVSDFQHTHYVLINRYTIYQYTCSFNYMLHSKQHL